MQRRLDTLCQDPLFEHTQLGLLVYDLQTHQPLYTLNATQRMRPASCQKLVTAITALDVLGNNYQFQTHVRLSGVVSGRTLQGNVYLIGGMDPLLSRDELQQIASALRQSGIDCIDGNVCVDLSLKDDKEYGHGWCWDDDYGPLSALLLEGKADVAPALFKAFKAAGITVRSRSFVTAECPGDARPLLTITHTMQDLLLPMMKESDNIFAECLFYQLAFSSGRKGAGRKQATPYVEALLSRLGVSPEVYQVADGSGLSLYNYLTPSVLVELLNYAYERPQLYQPLAASLPVMGVDGTLKKRHTDTLVCNRIFAKTGSVTGISSLSGYAMGGGGHMLSFCIINQGVERTQHGRDWQDKVCQALCEE